MALPVCREPSPLSLYALIGAIETGLVFALVALGSYLTFRVLDFPDLTVEGSFPLGAAVAAKLMVAGIDPWSASLAGGAAGCLAGLATAFLNLKLRILHILAGILTAIALYSINLRIMDRPNIGLINMETVYSAVEQLGVPSLYAPLVLLLVVVIVCKLLLDLFLATGFGLAMRAAGANPRMASANGVHVARMTVVGLAIANGLTGLSGAFFAQMLGAADVSMGIGVIVMALAAVIGGTALMPSRAVAMLTLACVLGSILYRLALAVALNTPAIGLTASDVNVVTAVLVAIALWVPRRRFGRRLGVVRP
jgi:putative tryptophan/tyrosine transport system permease protein